LKSVSSSFTNARTEKNFIWLDEKSFSQSTQLSVDHAVMEKTDRAAVLAVEYAWSDIGSWDAIYDVLTHDENANAVQGHAMVLEGSRNLVYAGKTLVSLLGVDDLVVVASGDAVLVTKRSHTEDVKKLVAELKARNFKEAE
jgi:mannose-1-phosphate guanylyltransferase / mannose-6-phosphate isomerase